MVVFLQSVRCIKNFKQKELFTVNAVVVEEVNCLCVFSLH